MSDTEATPEPKAPASEQPPADPAAQQDTDWKAEARKWEARAKANHDAATKLAEIEESKKSEAEKATDALRTAQETAKTAESRAMRLEVALDNGLPKSWAARLQGETREELEADAAAIAKDLQKTPPVATPPSEKLRPGSEPNPAPDNPDPKKLAETVLARRYGR